jgi:hypothetical protein
VIVIGVGTIISIPASRMVKMTSMPQLVALFNGVGGGAAGVVALLELAHADSLGFLVAVAFTVFIGSLAFSGSVVTFLKLQELMTTRPVDFPRSAVCDGGHYGRRGFRSVFHHRRAKLPLGDCHDGAGPRIWCLGCVCRWVALTSPLLFRCSTP